MRIRSTAIGTAVAAVALTLAAPALAGGLDQPVSEPVPAPVIAAEPSPADGAWSGFYVGASLGYGRIDAGAAGGDDAGALYGVHGGYMYDLGGFVLGGELEYQAADITDAGVEVDNVARLKARAGYDLGSFLPYVTAGVARAETSGAVETGADGAFAGLGVDYRLGQSFIVGAELLQQRFDEVDGTSADIDATSVGVRASFQF